LFGLFHFAAARCDTRHAVTRGKVPIYWNPLIAVQFDSGCVRDDSGIATSTGFAQLEFMRVVSSITAMQSTARRWRRSGARIGFVPTMGYLHAGHISLVKRARQAVGSQGRVVVSVYVNPAQFGPKEDFTKYPRDLKRDLKLCRAAGADVVFTPTDAAMYAGKAEGRYSTCVVEETLSLGMEGSSRPTHFRGVTTVVAKLFNCVLPDVAVFGAKDWQQAAVIRRMTDDLNFPIKIVVAPTLRERDGLAMSSRNKYLNPEQRAQAAVLSQCLKEAKALVKRAPQSAARLTGQLAKLVGSKSEARLDYIQFFDGETLIPVKKVRPGTHMALAVFFGKTRLIDNGRM
jgi:pantoate--beta-alanine ligase